MADAEIGARIARWRRRRGISQVALAGLVGRSESWLSQVERGRRAVDSLSALRELARVLRVDLDDLAPGPSSTSRGRGNTAHPAVERALLVPEPAAPTTLLEVTAVHSAYQAAHYADVLSRLPGLCAQLAVTEDAPVLAAGWTVAAKT